MSKQSKRVDTENTVMIGRGEEDGGMGEKGEGGYEVPMSSCKCHGDALFSTGSIGINIGVLYGGRLL